MTEREREALMRLTMCARNECVMCKYKDSCDSDVRFEFATKNMNILAEALRKTEPTISKMEQVDDEPQTENLFTDKDGDVWEWRGDAWYCISGDEPQTEDFKACVEGLTLLWIYNYVTDDEFHRIDARLKCKGEPQTEQVGVPFGEMDEATFKSHCLNCQRDTADIKCLDCDGNKYFLPYGSKTGCAWK